VGVLFGGRSGEHEVSLQSAQAVMAALRDAGHDVLPIGITSQGRWLVSGDPMRALTSGRVTDEQTATMLPEPGHSGLTPVRESDGGIEPAAIGQLDVVFPVLHGTYGEDGTVQGLFELASVPYVGSGVLGSALGMDKAVQKTLWRGMGLPVADFVSLRRGAPWTDATERVEQTLGYPCFVKPANLGSSVGVSKARDRKELLLALEEAARYDSKLLVEQAIDARELEVAILGNREPQASVVGEIVPAEEFYSYRAKYLDAGSRAIVPAEIPEATSEEVRRLAIAAFKAVDADGLARVDFFLERGTDRLYVNEINTMPGFTRISMYPMLWQASGLSFAELVSKLVELAEERFAERSRNETSYRPD
jgi:D-alanine-D-alanine ligase